MRSYRCGMSNILEISSFLFFHTARRFRRYFRRNKAAKIVTVLLFLSLAAVIGVGVFSIMRRGLLFTQQQPFLAAVLPLYVYEVSLLAIGYLVFFSALIVGLFGLFRGRFDHWIIASPQYRALPWFV